MDSNSNTGQIPQEPVKNTRKSDKRKSIIVIAAIVVFLVVIVIPFTIILPPINYDRGNEAFESNDYANAIEYYRMAMNYKDAQEKRVLSTKALHFEEGKKALKSGNYSFAIKELIAADNYAESRDLLYEASVAVLDKQDYENATLGFDALPFLADKRIRYYASGMERIRRGEYLLAVEHLKNAADFRDANERIAEASYLYAEHLLFTELDSDEAGYYYNLAGDYKDASYKLDICEFIEAERLWEEEKYEEARVWYHKLPVDFEYNGATITDRLYVYQIYDVAKEIEGIYKVTSGSYSVHRKRKSKPSEKGVGWTVSDCTDEDAGLEIKISISKGIVYMNCIPTATEYTNFSMTAASLKSRKSTLKGLFIVLDEPRLPKVFLDAYDMKLIYNGNKKFTYSYLKEDKDFDLLYNYIYKYKYTFSM